MGIKTDRIIRDNEEKDRKSVAGSVFRKALPLVTACMFALSASASKAEEGISKETRVNYDNFTVGGQSFNSMKFESPVPISNKVDLIIGVEKSQRNTTVVGTEQVTSEVVS